MSHEIESMAYAGEVPWHGLGRHVSHGMTVDEMLEAAGLNWTVSKRPVYLGTDKPNIFRTIPNQFALVRDTDEAILSMCKKEYNPVQNSEAMDFFRKFCEAGNMKLETAGSLKGGKFVWALAKLNVDFQVAGNDNLQGYLLLMSPHVVNYSMLIQFTPVRVVCWNTLSLALGASLRGSKNAFRMVHTAKFDDRMKALAEQTLGLATGQMQEFGEAAKMLAQVQVTPTDARQFFYEVLQVPANDVELMEAGEKQLPKVLKAFEEARLKAPGQNLLTAQDTLWGAFNAVTYVTDHERLTNRDNRLFSAWFDSGALAKRRALDLAMQRANKAVLEAA